jgi:hypothetical protein
MKLKVLYHDRCFDGLSSAAIFSRFYLEKVNPQAEILYQGLTHQMGEIFTQDSFDGDENVVVDFRYSRDPRLTWWFDHHVSGFPTPEDRAHFASQSSDKQFYDPKAKSCAKFIARTLTERFGFDQAPLRELIDWAEIIDGAQFPDAKTAVELKEPALQLMTVIEGTPDPVFLHGVIRDLMRLPLSEVAGSSDVARRLAPLLDRHLDNLREFKDRAKLEGRVVHTDLGGLNLDSFNKFIPYYLFPEATYTVTVSHSPERTKLSVGSNPWRPQERTHDLSKLCERYGGGGHPVVGAVSLGPSQLERARAIATEMIAELQR